MPDLIEYDGGDILASLEDRTITGLLIPFNELGQTNAGRFMVEAGAVALPDDPSVIGLNTDHDRSRTVGRATRVWQDVKGIMATFTLARTPEGDAALADATNPNGRRRKLSGEFETAIAGGKAVPGSGRLWGAALVPQGAFPSAMVLAADTTSSAQYITEYTDENGVTWRRVEETVTTTTEEVVSADPEAADDPADTTATDTTTEGDTTVPNEQQPVAVAATRAVPPTQAPAARTASRGPDTAQVLAAVRALRTNPGDTAAVQVLASIADVPMAAPLGTTPGSIRENWLGKIYQGVTYARQFIDLGTHGTAISAGGKAGFRVFRGDDESENVPYNGSWAGFPNDLGGYSGSTDVLRSYLEMFALGNAIDRRWIDLPGGEEVLASFLQLVIEDYLIWSDRKAREALISQAVPVVAATAKYPTNYPPALGMLIQGILAVKKRKTDQRNDVPTFAIANDAAFEALAYAAGGDQNLPEFVKIALSTDRTGTVDGDVQIVNGDTGITGTASVVVGAKAGIDFDELPGENPLQIDALELARGGIDKATHGYLQTFVSRPAAFAHIGTPDAWAQGSYGRGVLAKVGAGILRGAPTDPLIATAATAASAPSLPGSVGGTVVDGSITWTRIA
jgi:hypothetical protein